MKNKIYKINDLMKNNSSNEKDFYEIETLINLEKYDEALKILKSKSNEYLEYKSKDYIILSSRCYIGLDDYNGFIEFYNYLKSLPYKSINQEEFINDLPNYYSNQKKTYDKLKEKKEEHSNIYKIYNSLIGNDVNSFYQGLTDLNNLPSNSFIDIDVILYEAFNNRPKFDFIKSMIFVQLVSRKSLKRLNFYNNGKYYSIIPNEFEHSYVKYLLEVKFYLEKATNEEKNISVESIFGNYFVSFIMLKLPQFLSNEELLYSFLACIIIGYDSIQASYEDDFILKEYDIDESKKELINKYKAEILELVKL